MIDFAKVTGITIPEGVAKQFTDIHGNVLWKEPAPKAAVNITYNKNSLSLQSQMSTVTIEDITYPPLIPASNSNDLTPQNLTVSIGTIITCKILQGGSSYSKITLNGTTVATGRCTYEYTVIGDVDILVHSIMTGPTAQHGLITITEK